ncbi:MAG: phenylalanine--tRNA ligase subunit beta [Clostridia bacterium]|nr:phenylalanine--tRNA ligase subunit beta [Clostridia bacterium]
MKISLNWINEFVDLKGITIDEINKKINQMCCEIEEITEVGKETSGVVFGQILEVKNHPDSNHLHILKVDVGTEVLQIVCGAPNVRVGMVTMVATVGGKVNGQKIKEAKLAGVESYGMCCSESELGIGSDDEGIADIDFKVTLGQDIKEVLPIDDVILEIDNKTLTNRPDLWGHYGMAREFSAIFDRPLKPLPVLELAKFKGLKKVKIDVKTDKCFRYSAMSVANITKKRLPMPLRIRLNYTGMRDINLLADITNLVMLELGQPMHAFDNNLVKDIVVREAVKGDKLLTLEGETHEVNPGSILICDGKDEPVAIAGIKGGLKSGITDETNSVLFESATFDSGAIRKTSRSIGLITDASLRYEKSLDPELASIAMARILKVLTTIDKNVVITSSYSDVYKKKYEKVNLTIDSEFVSKRIGIKVTNEEIAKILTKLGFSCKILKNQVQIAVPTFRATKDISIKEDIVEEVARMLNFGLLQPKPLEFSVLPVEKNREHTLEYEAKLMLAEKYGANEVHSYIWNYDNFNKEHKIETKPVLHLLDSKNAGQSSIRSEMVPTLLKFVSENKEQLDGEVRIFEIGRCVPSLDENKLAIEEKHLAIAFASQTKTQEELFFCVKKFLVDFASNKLLLNLEFTKEGNVPNYIHKVNSCSVKNGDVILGYFGLVNPATTKCIDKKLNICVCEIDFTKLCEKEGYKQKVKVPSAFQSVKFDLNFLVDKNKTYGEVREALNKVRSKILVGINFVEVFEGEVLGGKKSMLFNFEINGKDHTLSSEEIDNFRNDVIAQMAKNGYALR